MEFRLSRAPTLKRDRCHFVSHHVGSAGTGIIIPSIQHLLGFHMEIALGSEIIVITRNNANKRKTILDDSRTNSRCANKAPTFKLAVILLEICFPFSRIFIFSSSVVVFIFIIFFLLSYFFCSPRYVVSFRLFIIQRKKFL